MELQGKAPSAANLAKLPPYHEMQDIVEELLAAPWEPEDKSSSSSDSLSPRAPLVDMSSELYDFNVEETDASLVEASKCGEVGNSVKQAVELMEEEHDRIFTKETPQKAKVSYCYETEEDIDKALEENFENTSVITDLEDREYNWPIKDDNIETGADTYGFETEECKGRSQKDSEKAVVILKAEKSEYEGLNEVCDVDQAVVVLRSDTEGCERAEQEDNEARCGTFPEVRKKGHERMTEGENMENAEFLSRTEAEDTLHAVAEQAAEDNAVDIEYPTSVSNMRGPHRRTMVAEDGGAGLLCVGTHRFFHMQPETEQVVWGSRQAPDREPSISASGIYRAVDISASESCVNASNYINIGYKGTNLDGGDENTSAVNTRTSSSAQELYTAPSFSFSALETNADNEYQIVSDGNETVDTESIITVGLNAQPTVGVGEVKVEIHIVVANRAASPIKESSNPEAVSVTAPCKGTGDEAYSEASGRDTLDITGNFSETEVVCFGDEMVSVGSDTSIRTCSAEKCVQTDRCAYYNELISADNGSLTTTQPVSVDKFVQTDCLSVLQYEQPIIIYHNESSDSARNVNTTGAHSVDEDNDRTNVFSALSFTKISDMVRGPEQTQSISDNEYSDREEITGITNTSVSGESESSKLNVSNLFPGVGWLCSSDEWTVSQPDAVSATAEEVDVIEQFKCGRLDRTESISMRSRLISAEGERYRTASVDEEGRLVREGLTCTLQVLTYRDQLFPPLCPSCLLPQSAASIHPGGARVHNSAQVKRQSFSDHVTVLEQSERTVLGDQDNDLEHEYSLERLPSVEDYSPVTLSTHSTLKGEGHANVSTAGHLIGAKNSEITGNITSLLYQSHYGDCNVAKNSDVTREKTPDVSSRKLLDPTSGGDTVRLSLECRHGDNMGHLYSIAESEDGKTCQGHSDTGGEAEATKADGRSVALKVTSDNAIRIENTMDVDLNSVNANFTSGCAAINTYLINTDVKSDGKILTSDGATPHTKAMEADNVNVMLNVRKDRTSTDDCQLSSTNNDETDRPSERACAEQMDTLNATCDAEIAKKISGVDDRNVGLRLTGDCAVTCIIPTTIEQLIGATDSNNKSNTSFPFTEDKEDDAVNEASAVATTTRDNIRLDIDRCEASFQRHHVPDKLNALGGRVINHRTTFGGNDLSKGEDMGHQGPVEMHSSNKETQTAVNMSTITTTEASRKTVDKETQTKAVAYEGGDDKEEAKPTKQTERTEAQGELEKSTTEGATETKQRLEEKMKVAAGESHPYTAPSTTASAVSTADKRRTSSGDTGGEAAHDGTNCAATGSSEQEAPERGRAAENISPVPRDHAPVHRASDAAVPRDTLSAVGNRCGDAMRQKNKTNDNDATSTDVKAVIIANGGTATEAASGAANDCNGHVNNHHHHHHSTARSILKSVLKRTGSGGHNKKNPGGKATAVPAPPPPPQQQPPPTQNQPGPKKKHRVQFDESKNKFFDADYVILIREEEGEEEDEEDEESEEEEELEDEEEICTCGASAEMGRLRPPIVGAVRAPPPAGCRRPMQPPGGAVQVLPRTPGNIPRRDATTLAGDPGFDLNIPENCTFEPPLEFIDQVTLSPPEGYKDVVRHHQHLAGDPDTKIDVQSEDDIAEQGMTPAVTEVAVRITDQGIPHTVPSDAGRLSSQQQQRYIVETITMTTVTERRIVREADHMSRRSRSPPPSTDNKLSGILKGGKLWKTGESPQTSLSEADEPSDEVDKRSVRFYENHGDNKTADQPDQSKMEADTKDEEPEQPLPTEETTPSPSQHHISDEERVEDASSPECTELTLTFKLGQHQVLVANSLQRPNSAVRQLFPESSNYLVQNRSTSDDESGHQGTQEGTDSEKRNEAGPVGGQHQFLVTAESLRMFEEAKRAKLAQFYGAGGSPQDQHGSNQSLLLTSDTDDDSSRSQIRRTIERNTLRRSLLRYEPGNRNRLRGGAAKIRMQQNGEESLEERIRRLTCDIDEEESEQNEENIMGPEEVEVECGEACDDYMDMPPRTSPQGEETRKLIQTDSTAKGMLENVASRSTANKATSPSSASVTSTSSSSSTYKKLTDLFARKNNVTTTDTVTPVDWSGHPDHHQHQHHHHHHNHHHHHQGVPLDLGIGLPTTATSPGDQHKQGNFVGPKCAVSRASVTSEARKQFLSTLAPLAACVTSGAAHDDQEDCEGENESNDYYHQQVIVNSPLSVALPGDRVSVASSSTMAGGEEYSLDDIDEVLATDDQKVGAPQPDVVAGTPGGGPADGTMPTSVLSSTPVDELALFVEQDAGRIERIKKRYNDNSNNEDDEHDDYGFNRRPSVRGIKPRFGSTTEILQQMQSQLQPPSLLACPARSHVTWPYQENPEQSSSPTGDNCSLPRRRVPLGRGTVMPPVQEEFCPVYGNYNPTGILQAVSPTDRKDRRYVHHVMYPYQQLSPSTPQQQIIRVGGGCAEYPHSGTRTPPLQHLQYPTASNSPPPPGVPRNYTAPNDVMTPLMPSDGSTPPPGQYHQFPGSFQSLDRNASNLVAYGRRMTPPSGVVQMRISPVASSNSPVGLHHHQAPTAHPGSGVVKLSTFNDPSLTAIIEPHYSVMPHPQASSSSRSSPITATSVIRVGHGQQQTIRVPYPSGTPVQVHLLTRSGNESPQRGSPLLATRPQYVVARGTQTPAISGAIGSLYQVPPNARYYPNGAYMRQYLPDTPAQYSTSPQQTRGPMQYIPDSNSVPQALSPGSMPVPRPYTVDGLKPPQSSSGGRVYTDMKQPNYSAGKMVTSPVSAASATPPATFNAGSPTRTAATSGERGVPEGAASCSPSFPQDAMYQQVQPPTQIASNSISSITPDSNAATTSVYYAMNV